MPVYEVCLEKVVYSPPQLPHYVIDLSKDNPERIEMPNTGKFVEMENYAVAIIGGGISGLSFARLCKENGMHTVLLEKESAPGGCIHTHYFNDTTPVEMGAHTCYRSYQHLTELLEKTGVAEFIVKKKSLPFRLYGNGKFQKVWQPIHFAELFCSLYRIFGLSKAGKTLAGYYSSLFGKKNYDAVFSHLFNAVLSQDANDFPAEILFKKRNKKAKQYPGIFSFRTGMSHLVRSLSTDINMLTDFEVDKIERTVDGYILKSSRNQQKVIHARYLVLAAPPCSLQGILAIAEPALSDMLKEFKPVPVESVGIFLDKAIAGIQEVGVVIGRNEAFYSIVSMDPYDGKLPLGRRFTFHFRPGLLSLEQKMQIIRRVLNLREAQILDHYEKTSVFVSIPLHYKELLARIEQICTVKPLFLTGNYFEGVSLEDCVSRSVHEFDRLKRMERMDGLL